MEVKLIKFTDGSDGSVPAFTFSVDGKEYINKSELWFPPLPPKDELEVCCKAFNIVCDLVFG